MLRTGWGFNVLAAALLEFILAPGGAALGISQFALCLSTQGQGSVCQLDAGTYVISATLQIARSNLTVKGGTTNRSDTILRRAAGFKNAIMQDTISTTNSPVLGSITIRDLTIDGNRAANTDVWSSYQPEVWFFSTKSLLITNCDFLNSPDTSLGLVAQGTGGVVVNNSSFKNPVIYGLWSDPPGNHGDLDGPNGFLQCPSLHFVDSVVVANSDFENAGEPAILGDMTNLRIVNNTFVNNHSYSIPFNDSGGQIDLVTCTDNAAVVGNTFKNGTLGPNGLSADGVELHGTDTAIVDNKIFQNAGCGLISVGSSDIFLANWDPSTGTYNNAKSGLCFYHAPQYRPDDWIFVDRAKIFGNTAWSIWVDTADLPVDNVRVTNSCVQGPTSLKGAGTGLILQNLNTTGCGVQ